MNREFLFKGKHIHALPQNKHLNGKWIEGYLSDKNHINSPELGGKFLVDESTVCQYTGLTDKNGRRYEGDIFQASDGDYIQRYVITWNEDSLEWSAECIGDTDGTLPLSEFRISEIEIIGNIFDNPELLEIMEDGYSDGKPVYDMYDCPNCGKSYEIECEKYKHCPECGQVIGWQRKR